MRRARITDQLERFMRTTDVRDHLEWPRASYSSLLQADAWTIEEAAQLLVGRVPVHNLKYEMCSPGGKLYHDEEVIDTFLLLRGAVKSGIVRSCPNSDYITPIAAVEWALSKGIDVPSEIRSSLSLPDRGQTNEKPAAKTLVPLWQEQADRLRVEFHKPSKRRLSEKIANSNIGHGYAAGYIRKLIE